MSKKDIQLLLIVFGILIAFGSWQFVYKANQEKTETLQTENDALQQTVAELEVLESKKTEYLAEIDRMSGECTSITNSFVSGLLEEDEIMFLYRMETEYPSDIQVPSVQLVESVEVPYSVPTANAEAVAAETEAVDSAAAADHTAVEQTEAGPVDEGIRLYDANVAVGVTTTYNGLKDVIRYVYEIPARKSIRSMDLVVSDEGYLKGIVNVNFYTMTGTEVPYSYISIPGVPMGTDNIFGVINGTAGKRTAEQNAEAALQDSVGEDAEADDAEAEEAE